MSQVMDLLDQANGYGSKGNYDQAIELAEQALNMERTSEEDFLTNYILFMTYLDKYPARMEEENMSKWSYLPIALINKIDGYGKKVESCYNKLSEDKKGEFAEFNKDFKKRNKYFQIGIAVAKAREKIDKVVPKGCFIATAAMGSSLSEEVLILSRFRDEILHNNWFGRRFISIYYEISPPYAAILARRRYLRSLVASYLIKPLSKLVDTWLLRRRDS